MMGTISSRELNHDLGKAKRDALSGPVIITDLGEPAHVLLSIKDYRALIGDTRSIVDTLAQPAAADIDFEPGQISFGLQPAEFS